MVDAGTLLGVSVGGLAAGGMIALFLNGGILTTPEPIPEPEPVPLPTPIPIGFRYFYKNKTQCRDGHINLNWLVLQGIGIIRFQLWNDGRFYAAVCGGRSPLYYLVSLDTNDTLSRSRLLSLGFIEYTPITAPVGNDIPLPTIANVARTYRTKALVTHRAYQTRR